MTLEKEYDQVLQWCTEHQVAAFPTTFHRSDFRYVMEYARRSNNQGVADFLETLKYVDSKVLLIDVQININAPDEEETAELLQNRDEDEVKSLKQSIQAVSAQFGKFVSLDYGFIEKGVLYTFTSQAEWIEDYLLVEDLMNGSVEEGEEKSSTDLPMVELEKIAREVIQNSSYQQAKQKYDRQGIAENICEQRGISHGNQIIVARKAEEFFQVEILPKLEEEIRTKVLSLKAKGMKKTPIAGMLNLTHQEINKYFYSDVQVK